MEHQFKFIAKGCSIIFSSAYVTALSTIGYKTTLYGTFVAAQQQNKLLYNFQFVLMLVCFSAQKFCHRLARSTKHSIFSIAISVLEYYVARNNVMSCFFVQEYHLTDTAWDPISAALFDQVASFSDLNHLCQLLGPGFAPYSSIAFYILE